jgi:hypothetical protein
MTKILRMKFTGNAVLTPEYPDDLEEEDYGPLVAIMPGARRRRQGLFSRPQIDAQFAFVKFDYAQLVVTGPKDRDADYKYPEETDVHTGVCFLEREEIYFDIPPIESTLTFVPGDVSGTAQIGSTQTQWIARWKDFSFGRGALYADVVGSKTRDCVQVTIPGGEVSAEFIAEPIARIDFDYGNPGEPSYVRPYAQQVVVTMTFDDSRPYVRLRSDPFNPVTNEESSYLTFIWGGRSTIDLVFGNGSMSSLQSLLSGSFAGHDHQGDYDSEFQALYDIVDCPPDTPNQRQPLPHILSFEISHIPCISTMIGAPTPVEGPKNEAAAFAASVSSTATFASPERAGVPSPNAEIIPSPKADPIGNTQFKSRTLPSQGRQRR